MRNTIDFQYDRVNAVPHWKIQTRDHAIEWFEQYVVYLKQFDRKMDLVVVLDDFEIGPTIGVLWGEHRAKLHQQYTRFNYRVHSSNRVKLFVNTSGVRYDVATQEAATVEDAIEGILEARRRAA